MTNLQSGPELDAIFQALAQMGKASYEMAWANGYVEEIDEVPEELKSEMKQVNTTIQQLQEHLREIRKGMKKDG